MRKNAVRAPDERLAIARFLASGESRESNYKIGKAIVCGIVEEVCEASWKYTLKVVTTN